MKLFKITGRRFFFFFFLQFLFRIKIVLIYHTIKKSNCNIHTDFNFFLWKGKEKCIRKIGTRSTARKKYKAMYKREHNHKHQQTTPRNSYNNAKNGILGNNPIIMNMIYCQQIMKEKSMTASIIRTQTSLT